jgi:hypothetical protein
MMSGIVQWRWYEKDLMPPMLASCMYVTVCSDNSSKSATYIYTVHNQAGAAHNKQVL